MTEYYAQHIQGKETRQNCEKFFTREAVTSIRWLHWQSVGCIWAGTHVRAFWCWNAKMTTAAIVHRARILNTYNDTTLYYIEMFLYVTPLLTKQNRQSKSYIDLSIPQ